MKLQLKGIVKRKDACNHNTWLRSRATYSTLTREQKAFKMRGGGDGCGAVCVWGGGGGGGKGRDEINFRNVYGIKWGIFFLR